MAQMPVVNVVLKLNKQGSDLLNRAAYSNGMRECLRRTLRRLESWTGHDGCPEMEVMRRDIRRVIERNTETKK